MNSFDLEEMLPKAERVTELLKSLANQDRLLILCLLAKGEQSVSAIEENLDIHQPTLSQQLGILRELNIVTTRREGKRIFYSIQDAKVLYLLQTLHILYC